MIPVKKMQVMREQSAQVLDMTRKYVCTAVCLFQNLEKLQIPHLLVNSRNETYRGCFESKLNASKTMYVDLIRSHVHTTFKDK